LKLYKKSKDIFQPIKKKISNYFVNTLNIIYDSYLKKKHNSPPPLKLVSILMVSSGKSFFSKRQTNYTFPTTSNIDKFTNLQEDPLASIKRLVSWR